MAYASAGMSDVAHEQAVHIIGEYGDLFLFLLVAITYGTSEKPAFFGLIC